MYVCMHLLDWESVQASPHSSGLINHKFVLFCYKLCNKMINQIHVSKYHDMHVIIPTL